MKTRILTLLACLALIGVAQAQEHPNYGALLDIQRMLKANVAETNILAFVKNSHIAYNLDADAIIKLKQDGATPNVIVAMMNTTPAPVAQAAYPAPGQVVQSAPPPQVVYAQAPVYYAPAPVYVQPSPWCSVLSSLSLSFAWSSGGGHNNYCGGGGYHGYGGYHH
jgi:hypothetical protein